LRISAYPSYTDTLDFVGCGYAIYGIFGTLIATYNLIIQAPALVISNKATGKIPANIVLLGARMMNFFAPNFCIPKPANMAEGLSR